eukprot:TRINITY_DN660_c0_g2_i3.p1 TRINITY_DN660_c0_g2~~TRINITY_DN660_c0_g2_i3.p1  ORF type:complete len:341 (-),score=56.56 TRINITY_DN660_c0_g2_i3:41-1063(-)
MIMIIAYIIGWTILLEQRYLLLVSPVGSIRMSLQAPRGKDNLPDFSPADKIPYCLQNSTKEHNVNCTFWDENFVVFPITEDHDMFITTRVTQSREVLSPEGCSLLDNNCVYHVDTEEDYYTADIERFTLLLDHTVYAPGIGTQANGLNLKGTMMTKDGTAYTNLTKLPNQVGQIGKPDIIQLKTLLEAGGVYSLDENALTKTNRTIRYDGMVILLFVRYSNQVTYNTGNLQYFYSVKVIDNTKFKAEQPIFTKNLNNRLIWNRHGVRLIVLQVGNIGKFDFQVMLITFVSGLGLLAVATLVVDTLATKILPKKDVYGSYKYEETEVVDPIVNEHTPILTE